MTQLLEKWAPVLDSADAGQITDTHKRFVTATVLENQEKAIAEERAQHGLMEAAPTNVTGANVDNWDPVLISLVRRAMPNLMAFDVAGVQPMSGPTGLIFSMKSTFRTAADGKADGDEALHGEAPRGYSGDATNDTHMTTATGEALTPNEMGFTIDKTSVTAGTRALAASYSMELAQDLKAIHGLSAETELANILTTEILNEINRELVHKINDAAKTGTAGGTDGALTVAAGGSNDTDGRWAAERYKHLHFLLELEANGIATDTRRGKGNFVICSANVASALGTAGVLNYTPAMTNNISADVTGSTLVGTMGGMKVYVDPYAASDYATVGYKGTNPYDAGMFYCPYVPLTMMKAQDQNTFQPKIGFKTRYGIVANPFTSNADNSNVYYRHNTVSI